MRVTFYVFICFSLGLSISSGISYPQTNNWQRVYSGPSTIFDFTAKSFCRSDGENNFLFISDNHNGLEYVYKLNALGDIIQAKSYTDRMGNASVSSGDGGVVFSSNANNPYSSKIDSDLSEIWFKSYPYGGLGYCNDIIKTGDGFYILTGAGMALKINSNGDSIWRKGYPFGVARNFERVLECPDGNYILGGYIKYLAGTPTLGLATKVDTSGSVIWQKNYTPNNNYNYNDVKITKTNKNLYMAGWEYEPAYNLCFTAVLKMDFSGNVLDTFKYDFYNTDNYITDIKAFNDNRIILSYIRESPNLDTLLTSVLIIDSTGGVIVNREYTGANNIWLSKIYPIQPNTIYLMGTSTHRSYKPHAFLIKTDTTLYAPPVSVNNISNIIPDKFTLSQNYPNPFNSSTVIKFSVRNKGVYSMRIFDVTGKTIKEIFNQEFLPGEYKTDFSAENLSSGIYFYRIQANDFVQTKRMVLVK